jgi:ketosteroid isomerase-like protein
LRARRASATAAALLAGVPLAAVLLACSPLAAQHVGRPEDVVRAFHDALATGDSALVLTLLAENVVIFESGGVEASREEYRSHHLPADIAFARSTEKEVTVARVGFSGDVAWVLSHSTTMGSFRGRDVNSAGTETMILRQTQMGWRIEHIHWSNRSIRREGS